MIQSVNIQNFKSIEKQIFDLKPLTILTGTNSSGKSSVIQAILLYSYHSAKNNNSLKEYIKELGDSKSLIKKSSQNQQIKIQPKTNNKNMEALIFNEQWNTIKQTSLIAFEQTLYYISANRIGQENLPKNDNDEKCGVNGEYIFGFYEQQKGQSLQNQSLISNKADGSILELQVNYWLKRILALNLIPRTEKITNTNIKLVYENIDLEKFRLSPFNLGAGVSYLAKILILGLSLQKGDILIVENPEVHLHPKAISKFAEFFVFLVNGGIQVILETHSEHIINKIRYCVFKQQISKDDIQIYYKENFDMPFDCIKINDSGKYINKNNEIIEFPAGFFDSDLDELLEMM
ncbi:AAA family ATPase [Helicobacter sp. 23-1044]